MDIKEIDMIKDLRHQLHSCPELSNHEINTKRTLMEFLKAHTSLEIVDRGQWFYALHHGCGKASSIALRADMDALPIEETVEFPYASKRAGVSHKCGHDGHCAVLSGVALELQKRSTKGDVYLIFQHAEEIGAGGEECAKLIEEKGISRIYALHNWNGFPENAVVVRYGVSQCASMGLTVKFYGIPSHASQPEHGKTPVPAVAKLALEMQKYYRAPGSEKGMVLCTIVHILVGNKDFGCAPANGEISVTLRTDYERDLDALNISIRKYAERLAHEYGLSVEFTESDRFPETLNNDDCSDCVAAVARQLGLQVVVPKFPLRASEDFGWYLKKCPGAMFYIGNGENYAGLHTLEYDFNDKIISTGIQMFLGLIEAQ